MLAELRDGDVLRPEDFRCLPRCNVPVITFVNHSVLIYICLHEYKDYI